MRKTSRCIVLASSLSLLASGCGDAGVADPAIAPAEVAMASDRFSEWSAPVNIGPVVNSAFHDAAPEISKDGLSLYFGTNRPGYGGNDIWVSQRASVDDPWGPPVNIGAVVNTVANESGSHLSRDGHYLYFTSTRAGGLGGNDLYVSWRDDIHDDFAWGPPRNLGAPLNSAQSDLGPTSWGPEFYLWRGPAVVNTPGDIYMSRMIGDRFTEPQPVAQLNSAVHDEKPTIRFDGQEIIITSRRDGTLDLWVSTRDGNGQEWSAPLPLTVLNTPFNERRPTLSADGTMLFFDSDRGSVDGTYDIYYSTRTLSSGRP
jgi:hypothetical protein